MFRLLQHLPIRDAIAAALVAGELRAPAFDTHATILEQTTGAPSDVIPSLSLRMRSPETTLRAWRPE